MRTNLRLRSLLSVLIFVSLFLAGCALYKVKVKEDAEYNSCPGIPFRVKTLEKRHETVFQQTFCTVKLSLKDEKKTILIAPCIPVTEAFPGELENLKTNLDSNTKYPTKLKGELEKIFSNTQSSSGKQVQVDSGDKKKIEENVQQKILTLIEEQYDEIKAVFKTFQNIVRQYSRDNSVVIMVSNGWKQELVVEEKMYYYNINRPLIGTASGQIELKDDMTMSKAQAQVEDKTLSTILSMIPVSEIIKSRVVPIDGALAALSMLGDVKPPDWELSVEYSYVNHIVKMKGTPTVNDNIFLPTNGIDTRLTLKKLTDSVVAAGKSEEVIKNAKVITMENGIPATAGEPKEKKEDTNTLKIQLENSPKK